MGTVFGVNNKRDERLDKLKEILLTLALFQVYDENIDKNNRLYQLYDGTMLPSASGYSDLNALSTYISHGGDKSKAINMFMDKNILDSDDKLVKFIDALLNLKEKNVNI